MTLKTWFQCLLGHRAPVVVNTRRALIVTDVTIIILEKKCTHCGREWEEIV